MTDDDPPLQHPQRRGFQGKRPEAPRKEYDALVKAAWKAGWWCKRRSNNYIACQPPDGRGWVNVPSTPSKQGTLDRTRRSFRKYGLDDV